MKLERIKFVLYALLILMVTLRQNQMQHEIDRLRESHMKFQQQMIEFMETTNSSIRNNTQAIASGTRIMKTLAGMR